MSGGEAPLESPELFFWYKTINLRAYKVAFSQKTVAELESAFSRIVIVEKIKRLDELMDPQPDTIIKAGDEVALAGDCAGLIEAEKIAGPEIDDRSVMNIIGEIVGVCVLKNDIVGKTLGEISREYGHGCYLRKLTRQEQELPLMRDTVVHKCDVLQVAGSQKDVERFIKEIGYAERSTSTTDLIMVGLACAVGTLLGLITVPLFGIPVTMGVGGGVLLAGLVCGWLRAVHPTFGQIPLGAQWIFTDLGLNLFIVSVGLMAAPQALHALQTTGASIFLAGAVLSLMPMIVGLIFGKFILKLEPVLLFGALTGAGTVTPALNALKEEADSSAPALGFAVPYAFGNVILTVWGTVIVHLLR